MAISKVVLNGTTLMDATTATATAEDITAPKTAMLADGVMTTGTGSGGITPTGTKQISITSNGTTTEDVTNYASAEITVNVSGGGGADETGSFVAVADQSNLTISVTALHSHILIWDSVVKGDDGLTDAPYGTQKTILTFADGNTGFVIYGAIANTGTAYYSTFTGIGRWGGNTKWSDRVEFTASTIKIINPRVNGVAYPLIDGHTYNWRAW